MMRKIYCQACRCDRLMAESEGALICSSCGARFTIDDLLNSYYTMAFARAAADYSSHEEREAEAAEFDEDEETELEESISDDVDDLEDFSEEEAEALFFEDDTIDITVRAAHGNHNGLAYIFEGDYKRAEEYFDRVLTLDDENAWAWFFKAFLEIEGIAYSNLERCDGGDQMPIGGFGSALIANGENPQYSIQSDLYMNTHTIGYASKLNSIAECFQKALQYSPSSDILTALFPPATTMLAVAGARIRLSTLKNAEKIPSTSFIINGEFLSDIINDLIAEMEETARTQALVVSSVRQCDESSAISEQSWGGENPYGTKALFEQLTEYQEYQTALTIWDTLVEPHIYSKSGSRSGGTIDATLDAFLASIFLMDSIVSRAPDLSILDDDWLLLKQKAAQRAVDLRRSFVDSDWGKAGSHLSEIIRSESAEKNLQYVNEEMEKRHQKGALQK